MKNLFSIFLKCCFCCIYFQGSIVLAQGSAIETSNFEMGSGHGFIENLGQVHDQHYASMPEVLYLLPLKNLNVTLHQNGFHYDSYYFTSEGDPFEKDYMLGEGAPSPELTDSFHFHRVEMEFVGANATFEIEQLAPFAEHLNYHNPLGSFSEVGIYEEVIYRNVWPHIDILFKSGKTFEYDFILHPGAKIEDIKIEVSGPLDLLVKEDEVNMQLTGYSLLEEIPRSYWANSGDDVGIHYRFADSGDGWVLGFGQEGLKIEETLIIDPTPSLLWGTYVGGSDVERGHRVGVTSSGEVVVLGSTSSINAIATSGTHQNSFAGVEDIYLIKYASNGTRLWGTYFGGSDDDESIYGGLVLNEDSTILIFARSWSTSGIATSGVHQDSLAGDRDAVIAKFSSQGTLVWSTYYGGMGGEDPNDAVSDGNGGIWITGFTTSQTGIATPNSYQDTTDWSGDAIIAHFDGSGNLLYGTYYGGTGFDVGASIKIDKDGNINVYGYTYSNSGIATPGSYQPNNAGDSDAFIVQFDSSFNRIWGTYLGGGQQEWSRLMAVDGDGNIVVTGYTESGSMIATLGAHQDSIGGGRDIMLAKFDQSGTKLWGTYAGGLYNDQGYGVETDSLGNIMVVGLTQSFTGISTANSIQPSSSGGQDGFLLQFSPSGQRLWGSYYGGIWGEILYDVAIDQDGNYLAFGQTGSTSGIATPGAAQPTFGGFFDAFLIKFGVCKEADSVEFGMAEDTLCLGSSYTLSVGQASLNDATNWNWYEGSCGGTLVGSGPSVSISPAVPGTYYVRGEGGCVTSASCSSIDLVLEHPDTSISVNGAVLTSNATGATYQWLDCDAGFAAIPNATNSSFTPQVIGSYAVSVSQYGCSDTSACIPVTMVGIDEEEFGFEDQAPILYPNPNKGTFFIEHSWEAEDISFTVFNQLGQIVKQERIPSAERLQIDLSGLADGIYQLKMEMEFQVHNLKIVVQRQ